MLIEYHWVPALILATAGILHVTFSIVTK